MEMRILYLLLLALASALTLSHGGWNISNIVVQLTLNLGS